MKKRFALTTFLGLAGGLGCVAFSIAESGNLSLFINIPSFLIIVGGTVCVLIMSFPFSVLKTLGKVILSAFVQDKQDPIDDINQMSDLCVYSRKNGLLALEKYTENINDPFLKKGLNLVVDGIDRDVMEASMSSEIYHISKRHKLGVSMVSMIASVAPGLGLVGTYIGLIPMLTNMMDPDKLGPMMAIELVSSFYGGVIANIVFSPLAKRLQSINEKEKDRNELLLEGLLGIRDGKNPRMLREDLMAFLTKRDARKAEKKKSKGEPSDGKVLDFAAGKKRQKEA
jgi:chemotaxis protein MotA